MDTFVKEAEVDEASYDENICKVSIVGVGMKSHTGVAAKAFSTMAKENININMISTSEIKVSMVIDEKYAELAVRSLHAAYELDK
jgi:aspartate kinase